MNLNSYIGLMGGRYRESARRSAGADPPAGAGGAADLDVPDPDYVLTLDADSVLLPEYCLRLVHLMEQRGERGRRGRRRRRTARSPAPPTRIERIAGATTDLQHIVHQGMTYYDATFWVGRQRDPAQARARRHRRDRASQGGFEIRRYIQDRTVIEDTESTIDLAHARLDASTTTPSG